MMSLKEALNMEEKEKTFLDTLDLQPFLVQDKDLYDIMQEIENKYNEDYKDEDFIFNCMNVEEFASYLENRYSIHFRIIDEPHYEIYY